MSTKEKLIARPDTILQAIAAVKRAPFPSGAGDATSRKEWQDEQKQALNKLTALLFADKIG